MHIRKVLAAQLEDRLDRLQASFADLNGAVRDKVAEIIGKSVQDLARQAMRAALEPSSPAPVNDPDDDEDLWEDHADYRHPRMLDQDVWRSHNTRSPALDRPLPRTTTAVLYGCKAASWWVTRASNVTFRNCLFVGLIAGGIALAMGPIASAFLPAVLALTLVGQSTGVFGTHFD